MTLTGVLQFVGMSSKLVVATVNGNQVILLARSGGFDPISDATAFLQQSLFGTGSRISVSGQFSQIGGVTVFFVQGAIAV